MDWSLALLGLMWGLISAVSLPLGAVLGLWTRPSKRVTAALMAFGGGALLFALTIELFGHALHAASDGHGKIVLPGLALAAMGAGAVGGLLFQAMNRALEKEGGFLRKRSLIRKHVIRKRRRSARKLLGSLSRVALFRSLPPDEVIALVTAARRAKFTAGETIFEEGDAGHWMYVVERGTVRIVRGTGDVAKEIAVLKKRDVFGEIALVSNEPRTATAQASTDVEALRIPRSAFEQALHRSAELRESVGDIVAEHLDELGERAPEAQAESEEWARNALQRLAGVAMHARPGDVRREAKQHGGAAMAIWLGIGLDAIPESLVIGMLVVAAAAQNTTISLAFVAGVFLANLPEAMSSAVTMSQGGMRTRKVMWMWMSLCLLTGLGALLGTVLLPGHPTGTMLYVVFAIEGLAAGAMLTMIAETMLPEAYEQGGGAIVGLATLAGFLAAMSAKLIH